MRRYLMPAMAGAVVMGAIVAPQLVQAGPSTRDVQLSPVEPVTFECNVALATGDRNEGTACYDVPDGTRLVIETAAAYVDAPPGQSVHPSFDTPSDWPLPVTAEGPIAPDANWFTSLQDVRIYVDDWNKGGTTVPGDVRAYLDRWDASGGSGAHFTFSGYLLRI